MKVLFLTTGKFQSINQKGIYPDLLREFAKKGHSVFVVSARQKRENLKTTLVIEEQCTYLKVKVGNITKSNVIEKGIATLKIERQYKKAIKKYFSDHSFDLIIYSTPPITFASLISYLKNKNQSKSYLLLKDIFPQNAVDLDILKKSGIKGFIYKYFRYKEKKLYDISDYIGCMSEANVEYILKHNHEISKKKVEICPNSIEVIDSSISSKEKYEIRKKYNIPINKKVFVYGGNLGKPQGIDFLIECVKSQRDNDRVSFLIVGDGTEFRKLKMNIDSENLKNVILLNKIPKEDYEKLAASCDVGMIFLDHRFTIPNFPSRLLSYMQARIPVFALTDPNTDVGKVIVEGNFGWWMESNSIEKFDKCIDTIIKSNLQEYGDNGMKYLLEHYTVDRCYEIITNHF